MVAPQEVELLLVELLHGHDLEAELERHRQDGRADGSVVVVGVQVADEGAVDLQRLQGVLVQVAER